MPHKKTFSGKLIEMEGTLGISPETLAFILGIKYEMFRRYRNGDFDKTYSIRKDRLESRMNNIDIEIEDKANLLRKALRNFHKNYGNKNGNTRVLKRQNLNGKGAKQKNLRSL